MYTGVSNPSSYSFIYALCALDDEEYEVEQILKERVVGRGVEYYVRWKGYAKCTWEPKDHLHCPALLKKFRVSLPSQR